MGWKKSPICRLISDNMFGFSSLRFRVAFSHDARWEDCRYLSEKVASGNMTFKSNSDHECNVNRQIKSCVCVYIYTLYYI